MASTHRLRELDFLRGLAIILVLLRHQHLFTFTTNMGWIGVDLFFTLSGFLVSGLLFKEYLKFGDIQPKRFLIRRGFKIYPIYYLFYIPYILPAILDDKLYVMGFLADMVFIQNYAFGWGYAYGASWSLAVEEHFYIALAILLWVGIKFKIILFEKPLHSRKFTISFSTLIYIILVGCFILRLYSNIYFPEQFSKNFTMTHLRIDSLMAGVFISYLFHFKTKELVQAFKRYKPILISIAFVCILWTPFIDAIPSFFAKTFGFTLLYISFGILLLYFILTPGINEILNKQFSAPIVNIVSKIGFCSYSIYVIHTFVNNSVSFERINNQYVIFIVTSIISISLGILMTYFVENYFLRIRNKYVPNRA